MVTFKLSAEVLTHCLVFQSCLEGWRNCGMFPYAHTSTFALPILTTLHSRCQHTRVSWTYRTVHYCKRSFNPTSKFCSNNKAYRGCLFCFWDFSRKILPWKYVLTGLLFPIWICFLMHVVRRIKRIPQIRHGALFCLSCPGQKLLFNSMSLIRKVFVSICDLRSAKVSRTEVRSKLRLWWKHYGSGPICLRPFAVKAISSF